MFRANNNHNQQTLSDSTQWMNTKIREKLEKSWAPIFYEHVFCKIDEEPFAVLYGTTGKPNFPGSGQGDGGTGGQVHCPN